MHLSAEPYTYNTDNEVYQREVGKRLENLEARDDTPLHIGAQVMYKLQRENGR